MKKIKIKPKPKPNDFVTTTSVHDDNVSEIKELKDDIFNLKKELIELKAQFEIFKQHQSQQQSQNQSQQQSQQQLQHFCNCDFIEWANELEIKVEDLEKLFKSKD